MPAFAVADVQITSLTATPAPVLAGNDVTFAVTVANVAAGPGNGATNVALTLPVSSTLYVYQSESFASGTCSATSSLLTCDLGSIAAGGSKSGNIVFHVPAATADQSPLTLTYSVVSTEDTTADTEPEDVDIDVAADLVVDKKVPSPTNEAVPGQNVVYTVDVQNNGPSDATGVTLTDPGPAGFGAPTFSGACAGATCSLGTIQPGAANKKTVTVTFALADDYHLLNGTASVTNLATAATAT